MNHPVTWKYQSTIRMFKMAMWMSPLFISSLSPSDAAAEAPRERRAAPDRFEATATPETASLWSTTTGSGLLHAESLEHIEGVPEPGITVATGRRTLFKVGGPQQLPAEDESTGTDIGQHVAGLYPSPDRNRVAVQAYVGPMPVVWILETGAGSKSAPRRLAREGFGLFMGWHPDSSHALYSAWDLDVVDPGLWVVSTRTGAHERIHIPRLVAPEALTAASFSPDGTSLLYALTYGMGSGSEIWSVEDDQPHRLVWKDPYTVVSSLVWSPDGAQVAFSSLLDAPVPFAEAGLWVMDYDGAHPELMAVMDGGHGQTPVWQADSTRLLFVVRDNPDDLLADYDAAALMSSIHALDTHSGDETTVVPAAGFRHLDLTLTGDETLMFASDRSGALEIWTATVDGTLQQLTSTGDDRRYPLYVARADQ